MIVAPSAGYADDDDLDDLMGGFDDDFDVSVIEEEESTAPGWLVATPAGEWMWNNVDVSGSIASAAVWSYLGRSVADSELHCMGRWCPGFCGVSRATRTAACSDADGT